jgi:hypothetical protein
LRALQCGTADPLFDQQSQIPFKHFEFLSAAWHWASEMQRKPRLTGCETNNTDSELSSAMISKHAH